MKALELRLAMNYKNEFTPDGKYVTMFIPVEECTSCRNKMVLKEKYPGIFSPHVTMTQKAQAARIGLHWQHGKFFPGEDLLCTTCIEAGLATFKCYICKETKATDRIQESIGILSTDYLCKDCYATVPAKVWDEKLEELEKEHEYDHG